MSESRAGSSGLDRFLAVCLVAGSLLLAGAAAFHPVLPSDAADQLHVMGGTEHWRTIHLAMLAGSALLVTGIWLRVAIDDSGRRPQLLVALGVIAVGVVLNALNIAYMAGPGTEAAARFAGGDSGIVGLFSLSHASSLMAASVGNLAVASGCALLGWVEWRDPSRPRWLAGVAWLAAAAGVLGVLFFDPASRSAVAAVAVLTVWALATGGRELFGRTAESRKLKVES